MTNSNGSSSNGSSLDRRRSRRATPPAPSPVPAPLAIATPKAPDKSQQILRDFSRSLGEVLIDITALEVNTMVVERIAGDKFMAWEVYRDFYRIDETWLYRDEIHESLRARYVDLRRSLEMEYVLLICDPESDLFDPSTQEQTAVQQERLRVLSDPNAPLDALHTQLPNPLKPHDPAEMQRVQALLINPKFSRSLRKMSELKAGLDNRNRSLQRLQHLNPEQAQHLISHEVRTDMIYAQTIIQLDGDVINRYSTEVFDHPHRDLILSIHKESVLSGEQQWRELLGFILDLTQKTFAQLGGALSLRKSR